MPALNTISTALCHTLQLNCNRHNRQLTFPKLILAITSHMRKSQQNHNKHMYALEQAAAL